MSRWESLLAVQALDTRLDQLAVKREGLPQRARLAEVRAAIAEVESQLTEVDERRGERSRSQQRLEDEVASLTERARQAEKQLYSGSVTNPRELQAREDDGASIRRPVGQPHDTAPEDMAPA